MIFSEIYGGYFNASAKIITLALRGELTERAIYDVVSDRAFGESVLNLPAKIKGGGWGLITDDLKTPLKHEPYMPLTLLQKRWLKTISEDPKFKLFGVEIGGLEEISPIYDRNTFVYFDRFGDGDPYEDEGYIKNFRAVLKDLRGGKKLRIRFKGKSGREHENVVSPVKIEYSPQDDKFRLLASSRRRSWIINLARVMNCSVCEADADAVAPARNTAAVVLELKD